MEYELTGFNTLILKKIFLLFRNVSANLQIVASANGLNLYALNGSNSAWLHIQLGKGFFKRIDWDDLSKGGVGDNLKARHWVISTKHLCQSLSIVVPPSQKNQLCSAVFMKDIGTWDDIRTTVALEKLILREDKTYPNLLSFILCCAGENITRSATVTCEEYRLNIPDELRWKNWHYLRIQPTVLYKSINPYSSQLDDVSISYDDYNETMVFNIVKISSQTYVSSKSGKLKKSSLTGQISINSRYFQKLELDDNIPYPKKITIALKELLCLVSFCESMRSPLSLVLKSPGDSVIALFGGAVNAAETVTDTMNIHHIVSTGSAQQDDKVIDLQSIQNNFSWSGSLWMSSIQIDKTIDQKEEKIPRKNKKRINEVHNFADTASTTENIDEDFGNTNFTSEIWNAVSLSDRHNIYNVLSLDFTPNKDDLAQHRTNNLSHTSGILFKYKMLNPITPDHLLKLTKKMEMVVMSWSKFGKQLPIKRPLNKMSSILHLRVTWCYLIYIWLIQFLFKSGNCIKISGSKTHAYIINISKGNTFNYKVHRFSKLDASELESLLENKYYKRSKYSKVGFKGGTVVKREPSNRGEINLLQSLDEETLSKLKSTDLEQEPKPETKPKVKRDNIYIDKSIICSTPLDEYIVVGEITATHGLKGYLKVRSYTNNPQVRLCKPGYRFLKFPFNEERVIPIKLLEGRLVGLRDNYLVKLEGIDTVEQALRMIGAFITVPLREVPSLEEDTYYSRDLLNLNVYLYNDMTKTKLGTTVGFIHRSDLASHPKYVDITEDLIEVEMDIKLSLKTLIDITRTAKENTPNPPERRVNVVMDEDLEEAETVDAGEELENTDMQGVHYIKYYVCSICSKQFISHSRALMHDKAHTENKDAQEYDDNEEAYSRENVEKRKFKILSLDEIAQGKIRRPIRRFYIPLLKEDTIKYVDVPNKNIYVDPLCIFIGEDGTSFQKD